MNTFTRIAAFVLLISCRSSTQSVTLKANNISIQGTWKLISGTTIEKNDTVVTDYLKGKSFIKILDETHFSFMGHDLTKGKETTPFFSSGGGIFELEDSAYTEHLEYCNDREWEGNDFHFTIKIHNDTLVQQGVEKIDSIGVDRINTEKYIRLNKKD